MLLALPLVATQDIVIEVLGELISKPYIDITLNLLQRFGVTVQRDGWQRFTGEGGKGIGHRLAISRIALERQTIEGDGLIRPLAREMEMPQLRERKRMIRGDGNRFFQHGLRRKIKLQLCLARRHHAHGLDMPGFEFKHGFKARNGFGMSLLHVQHDARLVPAVGEFRVEFNRLLQAGQGQGELVHLALNEAEIEPRGW
jgi:hypothetical protein